MKKNKLDDLLKPDLKLVVCGTAAGGRSAELNQYYANSGNQFWDTLHQTGLTPTKLDPSEYKKLLPYDIGLTDLHKHTSGMDKKIKITDHDISKFEKKIKKYKPAILCFNGKKPAKLYFKTRNVKYGFHKGSLDKTRIYVAPSTSGAAKGYWNIADWHKLAECVNS